MGKSKKSRCRKRDVRDMRGQRKSRESTKVGGKKSRGEKNSKRKKNYMLLIIFMVLIFNSLSFPKTKKQHYILPMASAK